MTRFDSASDALELIDSGKAKGQVVITMPPGPGTPTTPDTANAIATTEIR